jgi:hypothetical protein
MVCRRLSGPRTMQEGRSPEAVKPGLKIRGKGRGIGSGIATVAQWRGARTPSAWRLCLRCVSAAAAGMREWLRWQPRQTTTSLSNPAQASRRVFDTTWLDTEHVTCPRQI